MFDNFPTRQEMNDICKSEGKIMFSPDYLEEIAFFDYIKKVILTIASFGPILKLPFEYNTPKEVTGMSGYLKPKKCEDEQVKVFMCEESFDELARKSLFSADRLLIPTIVECPLGFFTCQTYKFCLAMIYLCDGKNNCFDGSDERDCPDKNEFQCKNGQHIPTQFVCDFLNNCKDSSDESDCSFELITESKNSTNAERFQCKNGQIITQEQRCNNVLNCFDSSDEDSQCRERCKTLIFCDNFCMPKEFICDMEIDCKNYEDEGKSMCENPAENLSFKYELGQHQNKNRTYFCRVVYNSLGKIQTRPNFPKYDLRDCKNFTCMAGEYQCAEKNYCIPLNKLCDNIFHCFLGDDEADCSISFFPSFFLSIIILL
ncbi:DgyrCDS14495 [Dimorphilus gyrociliatus]|uniref:DgyrCDS14495 n=1 Tax=Dimorphilus gyrociliatus TaxID=2664684 RepID=A0A7I8WDS5_9ANNE|nr:DgyrCDS14495 [Dimorphilus gyrociliatus]